eukprot:CAMPEP_0202884122 /NCGR_PEP_ID=MMETSP1391-20130828/40453_1 /ASSEMBLY_ACC=CAM_ASM_000867 /TAXON_ID=1034604 /ORGANISM="Chlamydomonas leiostraca, Strain SAG 11-49" /LENGTH=68 /DNA_ID=CAMNT_0049567253 /DNA_START=93 /DNA_END=295 /DNA_ORIENTATION=-
MPAEVSAGEATSAWSCMPLQVVTDAGLRSCPSGAVYKACLQLSTSEVSSERCRVRMKVFAAAPGMLPA